MTLSLAGRAKPKAGGATSGLRAMIAAKRKKAEEEKTVQVGGGLGEALKDNIQIEMVMMNNKEMLVMINHSCFG